MKSKERASNPALTKKRRSPLLSGAGLSVALLSVPVAAMLLSQPRQVTPPPPAPAPAPPTSEGNAAAPAQAARPQVPAAYVVSQWERLLNRSAEPSLADFTAFLRDYSNFPNTIEIRQRAERMMEVTTPPAQRLNFFAVSEPLMARGHFLYADALLSSNQRDRAAEEARKAWRTGGLEGEDRAAFMTRFATMMRPEDHAERADNLLWSGNLSGAAAMLSLLSADDRALTEARMALQSGSERGGDTERARTSIANVPASLRLHPGLIADQYSFARATGNYGYARQLLADTTIAPGSAGNKDKWMQMHLTAAEGAMRDGQYDLAYRIADHHGGLSFSEPLVENSAAERDTFTSLEWLAGWLAIHYLDRPADAVQHFRSFKDAAQFAPTIARGWYWAGRAAKAAGNGAANGYFAEAARYPLTFNGQLAAEELGRPFNIDANDIPQPSAEAQARFNADPRVEAVAIYGRQGERGKQRMFLQALADDADRETFPLVAQLANSSGNQRIATLGSRGNDTTGPAAIVGLSYPVISVPADKMAHWVRVHAIVRQESQFEQDAVSGAGARGLMQLMPATAKEQARRDGLSYNYSGLTGDPGYNIRLGSEYFSDMVDYWNGSVLLAIASYNAGPGNVRRWVNTNGDPRSPSVDAVRWIEEIPFYETKTYVRNVMSNLIVYEQLGPQYRSGGPDQGRLNWYLNLGS